MRIVCCFTEGKLRDETRDALVEFALPHMAVNFVKLPTNDPHAYGRELARQWDTPDDGTVGSGFGVVEPDIVIREDVVDAALNCDADYFAFPYAWRTAIGPALGCTFFRRRFTHRFQTAMDEALASGVGWSQLDVVLMRRVLGRDYGQQPVVILPPVVHLNEAKALLPNADPTPLMRVPSWDDIGNLAVE